MDESVRLSAGNINDAIQRHRNLLKVEHAMGQRLPTIFLLQIDGNLKKQTLDECTNWLSGDLKPSSDTVLNLKLSQKFSIYIVNGKQRRVISFNFVMKKSAEDLFHINMVLELFNIRSSGLGNFSKIYGILQGQPIENQYIDKLKDQFKNSSVEFIFCKQKSQYDQRALFIPSNPVKPCTLQNSDFFRDGCDPLKAFNRMWAQTTKKNKEIIRELQSISAKNQKLIQEIMEPLRLTMENICNQNKEKVIDAFSQLRKISDDLEPNYEEDQNPFRQSIAIDLETYRQEEESNIVYFQFFTKFEELFSEFKKRNQEKNEDFQNVKNFLKSCLEMMAMLPETLRDSELKEIQKLIHSILEQNRIINEILFAINGQKYNFMVVGLVDKWRNILSAQEKNQLIPVLTSSEISESKKENHYKQIENLVSKFFLPDRLKKQEKEKMEKQVQNFSLKIQKAKASSLINNAKNPKEKAKGVQEMLEVWKVRKNPEYGINFDEVLEICAVTLRQIQEPRMAMRVYQQMKFINKVQSCAKDVIDFEIDSARQAGEFYCELSKYFRAISRQDKSRQYAQMAKEQDYRFDFNQEGGKIKFFLNDYDWSSDNFYGEFKQKLQSLIERIGQYEQDIKIEVDSSKIPRSFLVFKSASEIIK